MHSSVSWTHVSQNSGVSLYLENILLEKYSVFLRKWGRKAEERKE